MEKSNYIRFPYVCSDFTSKTDITSENHVVLYIYIPINDR